MAMPDIQITPLSMHDAPNAYTIMESVQPGTWSQATFLDALTPPNLAWQICIEKRCIGLCIVQTLMTPQFKEWTLEEIAIHPEYQSQGYGHVMLEYMLKQAQELAVDEIFLEVRETNLPAQSLYTRHGFTQIDRRKGYYPSLPINGLVISTREDALIMRWASSQ